HRQWLIRKNSRDDPGLEAGLDAYTTRFAEIALPSLPDQMIESDLFGHTKGAFTGADRKKLGLLAGKGVDEILLDEIGGIGLPFQVKLLSVLESKEFRPVGAEMGDEQPVNARLLLATNRSLEK